MCGRFQLLTTQELEEVKWILDNLDREQAQKIMTGEIYPTNVVPVLMVRDGRIRPWAMTWGFPHFKGSGVIINARSESASEKPLFAGSVRQSRCVIPGTGFFEWKKTGGQTKEKILFHLPDEPVLYMAGLYRNDGDESRFVILTTAANTSVAGVHDRMPLILRKPEIRRWMEDEPSARKLLAHHPQRPALTAEAV